MTLRLTKAERAIVDKMNERRARKKLVRVEPEFMGERTTVTVDEAPKPMDSSEDVAELRELKD